MNSAFAHTDEPPWQTPAVVRIGEVLGSGAVGRVVRIEGAERALAGKILHPSHRGDDAARARFAQEARVAASLRHPHIVEVLGIETVEGESVLLMEFVDGPTLAQLLARRDRLPEHEVIALLRGIAAGLAHAHEHGVIHRDLKPANIFVTAAGVPKIGDFGMARGASLGDADRDALSVLGTPDYMAPECLDPLAVDGRSDLYALGCIAFELLTGAPPFSGATPHAVLRAHRDDDAPALPHEIGPALRGLVSSLLAKAPSARPQAAGAVLEALDRMLAGESISLALRDEVERPRCAACLRPLVVGVAACLHCGRALLRHEPGRSRVIVTGPGDVGDKLDNVLRLRLHAFLRDEPGLRLHARRALEKRIPRLPFVLVDRLSETQAAGVVAALATLGLQAIATEAAALSLASMRRKAMMLNGRVALIVATSSAGVIHSLPGFGALILAGLGLVVGTTLSAGRTVTKVTKSGAQVPAALDAAMQRLVAALPAVTADRHRDTVRAVAERALALAERPQLRGDDIVEELARAVDAATAAAGTLDRLDRSLGSGLGGGTQADRELLRERDLWAGRLQRVLAELEAIELRLARAHAQHDRADDDALAALRGHIEALEEVQS